MTSTVQPKSSSASVLQSSLQTQREQIRELHISSLQRLSELKGRLSNPPYERLVSPPSTVTGRSKAAVARSQQLRQALDDTIAKFQARYEEAAAYDRMYKGTLAEGKERLQEDQDAVSEAYKAQQEQDFADAQKAIEARMQEVREELRETEEKYQDKGGVHTEVAPVSFEVPQEKATQDAQLSFEKQAAKQDSAHQEEWKLKMAALREQVRHRANLSALQEVRERYQDRMDKLAVTIQNIKENHFEANRRQRSDSDAQLEMRKLELLQRRRAQQKRSATATEDTAPVDDAELQQATEEARARAIASVPKSYEDGRSAVYQLFYDDAHSRDTELLQSRLKSQVTQLEDLYVDGRMSDLDIALESLFISAVPSTASQQTLEKVRGYNEHLTSRQMLDVEKEATRAARADVKDAARRRIESGVEARYPATPESGRPKASSQGAESEQSERSAAARSGRTSSGGGSSGTGGAAVAVGVGAGAVAVAAVAAHEATASTDDDNAARPSDEQRIESESPMRKRIDSQMMEAEQSSADRAADEENATPAATTTAGASGTEGSAAGAGAGGAQSGVEEGPKGPTANEIAIMEMRKNIEQQWLKDKLMAGGRFLKHGRSGSPNKRLVWVSDDMRVIHWGDINKKKAHGSLDVATVISITPGQTTAVFQRKSGKKGREDFSFSIIGGDRTLDLEAGTVTEANEWINAFRFLLDEHGNSTQL